MAQTLRRTPLYAAHLALGARMVPFAGWEMPLQYQGILAESRAVRQSSGLFDISHMGRLYLQGPGAAALLDWVATNGVHDLDVGRARYATLCNEEGGILDDGIYYRLAEDRFLLVANAANRRAVWEWLHRWAPRFSPVELEDRTQETAVIGCQGPQAPGLLGALAPESARLRPFRCAQTTVGGVSALVARTGYTGEDGFEVIAEAEHAPGLWEGLLRQGAAPCGLGARDLLRLEAGLLLHGTDMDPTVNPLEAGLERFVRWDKEFVGAGALRAAQKGGATRRLVGFQVLERGIPRHGYAILGAEGQPVGHVTSGAYSPTLDRCIGLGYVAVEVAAPGTPLAVDVRGRSLEAVVVPLPFYSRRRP